MPLEEDGILAPEMDNVVVDIRKRHSSWFEFATRLNRAGQEIISNAQIVTKLGVTEPRLSALLLLVRTLSNFQGAILMAERGMVVESRTLEVVAGTTVLAGFEGLITVQPNLHAALAVGADVPAQVDGESCWHRDHPQLTGVEMGHLDAALFGPVNQFAVEVVDLVEHLRLLGGALQGRIADQRLRQS